MAERRMFAKSLTDSDAFLDMPVSAQMLYFHLAMHADDDGFVNSPRKIQRMIGANDDDMRILLLRQFIIAFDSGIIVIRHWRLHNYIRKDRHVSTTYTSEFSALKCDENGIYSCENTADCLPTGNQVSTACQPNVSIGKDSIGKYSIVEYRKGEYEGETVAVLPLAKDDRHKTKEIPKAKRFEKPTVDEIRAYCAQNNICIDAERFFDYYEANGWRVGKNPMKDWKAAVRTWTRNSYGGNSKAKSIAREEDSARIEKVKNKVFRA